MSRAEGTVSIWKDWEEAGLSQNFGVVGTVQIIVLEVLAKVWI